MGRKALAAVTVAVKVRKMQLGGAPRSLLALGLESVMLVVKVVEKTAEKTVETTLENDLCELWLESAGAVQMRQEPEV